MGVINGQTIKIADHGEIQVLSYAGLLDYHKGDAIWGLSVAFRALQLAASLFSRESLWDRKHLFIVSNHPGPGVRDAIEYVTHCISHNRFRLTEEIKHEEKCTSTMKFEWRIDYGIHTHVINLRDNFVPNEFYELLDRLHTDQERLDDKKNFNEFKILLAKKIWREPITSSYLVNNNAVKDSLKECINA